MKKLIAIVLVAVMLMAVLAACGGETTTTTIADTTTTNAPITTETPGNTDITETPGNTETEYPAGWENYQPLYSEGIDIMFGPDTDWWCINPTAYAEGQGCSFENHHSAFNGYCMVIQIIESMNDVYNSFLFPVVEDVDADGNPVEKRKPNEAYDFIVVIDGVEITVTQWSNQYGETTATYIRMGLGDWTPKIGEHKYQVALKVVDKNTGAIEFWANWGDTNFGQGGVLFNKPSKLNYSINDYYKIPAGVEMMLKDDTNYAVGLFGSEQIKKESYPNLFDADVNTKLCTSSERNVVFTVADGVSYNGLAGIALVGANDDSGSSSRYITDFVVYGSNSTDDPTNEGEWTEIEAFTDGSPNPTNFMLRYFGFEETVKYTYYKIVLNPEKTSYLQLSEIILFVEEDQWSVQ